MHSDGLMGNSRAFSSITFEGKIEEHISKLKQHFKEPTGKVMQNVDVKACLSDLHNKYVFEPADKAPNNT